jgi:hypothetical protein
MALDIDQWDLAAFELLMNGIDLQALYDAPDAVIVDSGRQGRGKLLFAMPFGLVLPTKKINRDKQTVYELRCGTTEGLTVQDVLPPSIHPDTHQPYRWAGRGHWTRLPQIPDALLHLWCELLKAPVDMQPQAPTHADWVQIEDALRYINPGCSRDEWITVGMALHYAGVSTQEEQYAAHLWDKWSYGSLDKYPGPRAMEVQWRSFSAAKATKVTLGSLFKLARSGGWSGTTVDASSLFEAVEMKTPLEVTESLRPPPPQMDLEVVPPALDTCLDDVRREPTGERVVAESDHAQCGVEAMRQLQLDGRRRFDPLMRAGLRGRGVGVGR